MNKFSALVCAFVCTIPHASAQIGSYLGPGILSRGAGTIGTRSGEQVDLRFYADVTGVYDTGLAPYAVDSKGNLITLGGLYGVQTDLGAYGTHMWKHALLGLDYTGNFIHYTNNSSFDTINQNVLLGYTYQKSKRLLFDVRQIGGIGNYGYGSPGFYGASSAPNNFVNTPTTALFDNRFYYYQTTMDVNILQSARTIYTLGGDGFWVRRQGQGLAGTNGYNLRGSVQHRLSKTRTIGATYQHTHIDFPPAFGESDLDMGQLFFSDAINRRWTFSLAAGAVIAQVQGIQQVALNPVIAALLGTSFSESTFFAQTVFPSGRVALTGRFKNSSLGFNYSQDITPGNGIYLTSIQKGGNANYTYNGIRDWSLGVNAGYFSLEGVGQGIQPYRSASGGFSATYLIKAALHAVARFDLRYQQIDIVGYKHTGYRATLGLAFSPGDLPLSLW